MVPVVLAARFFMELALLVAAGVVGASLAPMPWSVLAGLSSATVVAVLWGLVLSPRARVLVPLGPRLLLELGLVAAVAAGLWWSGRGLLAATLLATDVVVLGLLVALGRPPGPGADADTHADVTDERGSTAP